MRRNIFLTVLFMLLATCWISAKNNYKSEEVLKLFADGYSVTLDGTERIDPNLIFLDESNIDKIDIKNSQRQIDIIRKNKGLLMTFSEVKASAETKYKPKNPITMIVIGDLAVMPDEFGKYRIEAAEITELEVVQACDFDPKDSSTSLLIKTK